MLDLTKKQRKYIKKNRHLKSTAEMSEELKISQTTIQEYLGQKTHSATTPSTAKAETITFWRDLFRDTEIIFICLFIIVVAIFFNSFTNAFVSDDIAGILENPTIPNLGYNLLHGHPTTWLFSFIYNIVGTQTWLYHVNNTFWHFSVVVLIFLITRLLSGNKFLAGVTAFLFAVHPLHTENVTWVSGLPYLLYTFFLLLSFFIFVLVDKNLIKKWWLVPSALFGGLAFLSSEKASVLPLIIGLYVLLFSSFKKGLKLSLPLITVSFFYGINLLMRFSARVTAVNPITPLTTRPTIFNPLVQIPIALTSYLQLLFFPINQTFYHEYFMFSKVKYYTFAAVTTVFLILTAIFFRKNRLLAFFASLFVISLSPTLLPILLAWVVAERYVYLGSWGILFLISFVLVKIHARNQMVFWGLFIPVIVILGGLTIKRNMDWTSQDTLWPATVAVSPYSSRAQNDMGDWYGRHGDVRGALGAFSKAIEIKPDYPEAIHNLANTYNEMGEATKAAKLFQIALQYNPNLIESTVGLASVSLKFKDFESAKMYIKKAENIQPHSHLVYNAWGVYFANIGQKDKAIEMFQKALEINPAYPEAQKNLNYISTH